MWRLIIILIFLVASVWLGIVVINHPGYLLIVYKPWMVQTPLWFAVLCAVILLLLFYFFISSIDRIKLWLLRLKNWRHLRHEHRLYSKTQQGLAALIEGRWRAAEQLLLAGVTQAVDPLVNYLGAAKAAHELNAFDRRDRYLHQAYEIAPQAELAIGLTQAELEIEQHQYEHAAATLNHLRRNTPLQPQLLKLLEKIYVRLGDWKNLQALVPSLRKAKLITGAEADQFEKNLYREMLSSVNAKYPDDVHKIWQEIPRGMKKQPEVVTAYVEKLMSVYGDNINAKDAADLEHLIQKTMKYKYAPELVNIYGRLPTTNRDKQLVVAGSWLKNYGPEAETLLALGKICARIKLWGKAKDYFEKCLSLGPNPEASFEYGRLLETLGDTEEALQKYREGLLHCYSE